MDNIQLSTIKASISKAQESKDISRVIDSIAIGLVAVMECSAKDSAIQETIMKKMDNISESVSRIGDLEGRVSRIETILTSFEEQKKGASKLLNILIGLGIFSVGSATSINIKSIIEVLSNIVK